MQVNQINSQPATSAMKLARGTNSIEELVKTSDGMLTVTFWIGQQQYGLPVGMVIEIVRIAALTSLAGAPPAVIGLLNLRGLYVPVLDGSILVNEIPHYSLNNQIVIVGLILEGGTILPLLGLRVDQVIDVRPLHKNQLTNLDSSFSAPFLQGVIDTDEGSVILFDVEALLKLVPDHTSTH